MPTETTAQRTRCPLCDGPTYGWLSLPVGGRASVGLPVEPHGGVVVVDRCERCGTGTARGGPVDLEAELAAVSEPADDGGLLIAAPNRRSLQSTLGGEGWAALDQPPRRLQLTPAGLELLLERCGARATSPIRQPKIGRNTVWMLQTLINAFTFQPNFLRRARAREIAPGPGLDRLKYAIDWIVSVLATPLLTVVALLLETLAALARRGGQLRARATRDV